MNFQRYSIGLITIMTIGMIVNLARAATIPLPVGEPFYELEQKLYYQRLVARGELKALSHVGPFVFSSSEHSTPSSRLIDSPGSNKLRLFGIAESRSDWLKDQDANYFYGFTGGMRYDVSNSFGILARYRLDREAAIDPEFTGKSWRGLAASVETAAIYYSRPTIDITFGRQRLFWGPQPVNLVLSETAEPLDLFSFKFHKGRVEFSMIFARLDQSRPDATDLVRFPNETFTENRYLAGHRLDLRLHKNIKIGLFEMSLYGGEGRSPELYYLNPFQVFHTVQLNEQLDDNTAVGFDFTLLPMKGYALYGQLLVDDFQIDSDNVGDQEPNEIGLMAGIYRAGTPGSWSPDIVAEYVRIANRTYHQRRPRNRYLYRNQLLGHPLGPDADSLSLMFRFWPSKRQFIALQVGYRRLGEGSIRSVWNEPWLEQTGDYSEPFPTGSVEKAFLVGLRLKGYLPGTGYLSQHTQFGLDLGYGNFKNRGHVTGLSDNDSWIKLSINWTVATEVDLND